MAPSGPAAAASTYLCTGYSGCASKGYSNAGYAANNKKMYWRMYSGHNCTNYVAYRMVRNGMPNTRPWSGSGNATNWGVAMDRITDGVPMVGSVAWWKAGNGVGSSGHVAYVEQVVSATTIVISEDSWGGDFHWRRVTKSGSGWPSGFIHFKDAAVVNRALPVLGGSPRVGSPVTVSAGAWAPAATSFAYQWLVDGVAIRGATGTSYTPAPAHRGKRLSVQVVARRSGYVQGVARSAAPAVGYGVMTPTSPPVVSGTPYVDEVLTVSGAAWSPAASKVTVQWYADGEPIPGATGTQLQLGQAQVGKTVTAAVTGSTTGYAASTQTSAPTEPILAGVIEQSQPFGIAGGARVGAVLAVRPGVVEPRDATIRYHWLRNGQPIPGATGTTYRVTPTDLGRRIAVRVDISRPRYRSLTQVVPTPERVRTPSRIIVRATGGVRRVTVRVRVTAPGLTTPMGVVTATVAGRKVTAHLRGGVATLAVSALPRGTRVVRVHYAGGRNALPARAATRTRIR